jgi:transcriptional regulator with XRE-family HTH domain
MHAKNLYFYNKIVVYFNLLCYDWTWLKDHKLNSKGGYVMSEVGDLLHMERRRRKMNLREVGDAVGISPIYISEIETGKKIPINGNALTSLAIFFELDPAELTRLAFRDKAEERVQGMDSVVESAIARKKRTETLLSDFLEGKGVSHR